VVQHGRNAQAAGRCLGVGLLLPAPSCPVEAPSRLKQGCWLVGCVRLPHACPDGMRRRLPRRPAASHLTPRELAAQAAHEQALAAAPTLYTNLNLFLLASCLLLPCRVGWRRRLLPTSRPWQQHPTWRLCSSTWLPPSRSTARRSRRQVGCGTVLRCPALCCAVLHHALHAALCCRVLWQSVQMGE